MHPPDHLASDPVAATLAGLEWPRLLERLDERVATDCGRARLAALAPLTKLGAVRHSLGLIDGMKALRAELGPLSFAGVHSLAGVLERAERRGRLEVEELAAVLTTQRAALQLRAGLQSGPHAAALGELAAALHPLRELVERLGQSLTPAGALNERAYPELGRLREQIAARREEIHRKLERLLRTRSLADAFQDQIYTLRGRRYVLPVKADFKGHLPGIVHDVSARGATLFMEPQAVVEDTNALALTERLLELEADRILRELSWAVGEAAPALAENLDGIGRVDLLHAQAALSEGYQGTAPRVEREGVLDLKGVAHPLMLLDEAPGAGPGAAPHTADGDGAAAEPEGPPRAVRNALRLGAGPRCMVVSGANTGGKTVLLKAVGLCAVLVRHGMHVPALAGSRCDWFAEVWADIGDQQSLASSLSTFSAQIRFLMQWLPHAGPDSLVLLDEMLTGTEPAQGAALAGVVLEALLEQGATTLVTTHFGELKELAARHEGIVNASMAFDAERMRPTYRLQVGLPGASYAVHIARRYGLPDALVRRAEAALAERPAALDALLVQYHEQQRRLDQLAERLRRRETRLRQAEEQLAHGRDALESRERDLRRRERGAISAELRKAQRRIGAVIGALQRANSLPTVSRVREQLAELEREFEGAPAAETPPPSAGPPVMPQPGDAVWLPSLNRGGELEALLDEGRRARVRLGALSLEVAREELAVLPAPPPTRSRKTGGRVPDAAGSGVPVEPARETRDIPFALSTGENTLDVRGQRLEEAMEQAEQFFDRCTMKHVSPVMVIHGHGTGRLKAGLREQWRHSPYVAAFRPGEGGEGRDGVTILALNL